jgi:hypothetical protein
LLTTVTPLVLALVAESTSEIVNNETLLEYVGLPLLPPARFAEVANV